MREEERGETEREAGEEVDVEITDINISLVLVGCVPGHH